MSLTRESFAAEYERLVNEYKLGRDSTGCIACEDCTSCVGCMFSKACVRSLALTHSVRCVDSFQLTQCTDCTNCQESAYCERCDSCSKSNYLLACTRCVECDYCFGCVGLQGKDFHILNKKYSRGDYFRIVKALRLEMGLDKPSAPAKTA